MTAAEGHDQSRLAKAIPRPGKSIRVYEDYYKCSFSMAISTHCAVGQRASIAKWLDF